MLAKSERQVKANAKGAHGRRPRDRRPLQQSARGCRSATGSAPHIRLMASSIVIQHVGGDESLLDQPVVFVEPKEAEQEALRRVDGGLRIEDQDALAIRLWAPRDGPVRWRFPRRCGFPVRPRREWPFSSGSRLWPRNRGHFPEASRFVSVETVWQIPCERLRLKRGISGLRETFRALPENVHDSRWESHESPLRLWDFHESCRRFIGESPLESLDHSRVQGRF